MEGLSLSVTGLDEMAERCRKISERYQYEVEETMIKSGNELKKEARKQTASAVDRITGRLERSYTVKVSGEGSATHADLYNTAPHFHLVENGHIQTDRNGNEIGFVPGRQMVPAAVRNYEPTFYRNVEKLLDELGDAT